MTSKTTEEVRGGTEVYNAPEKVNGDDWNKLSHDLWAFAVSIAVVEGSDLFLFYSLSKSCFKKSGNEIFL